MESALTAPPEHLTLSVVRLRLVPVKFAKKASTQILGLASAQCAHQEHTPLVLVLQFALLAPRDIFPLVMVQKCVLRATLEQGLVPGPHLAQTVLLARTRLGVQTWLAPLAPTANIRVQVHQAVYRVMWDERQTPITPNVCRVQVARTLTPSHRPSVPLVLQAPLSLFLDKSSVSPVMRALFPPRAGR